MLLVVVVDSMVVVAVVPLLLLLQLFMWIPGCDGGVVAVMIVTVSSSRIQETSKNQGYYYNTLPPGSGRSRAFRLPTNQRTNQIVVPIPPTYLKTGAAQESGTGAGVGIGREQGSREPPGAASGDRSHSLAAFEA